MKRVSALILFTAMGVHSFGVNSKTVRKLSPAAANGPFTSMLPFPSPTSLQQSRWDRDYRDNSPVGDTMPSRNNVNRPYDNRNSFTGPPSVYNEAPTSTEAGWWNEEKTANGRERRVYSSGKYKNGDSPYMPIANVNRDKYGVIPDEWKNEGPQYGGSYSNNRYYDNYDRNGSYGNSRRRQTLRANDQDPRAYQYDGMPPYENGNNNRNFPNDRYDDPNAVTPSEWRDQKRMGRNDPYYDSKYNGNYDNNYAGQYNDNSNMNNYNYGFGGSRGQVVGTFNNENYNPNDVTPVEWQDSRRSTIPDPVRQNMNYGRNNKNNNNINNDYNENNRDYRVNYNDNFNHDNGLYDPTNGEGNWWNQESKDYRTNIGRQETRSFDRRPMSKDRNAVIPDEWSDQNRYNQGYRFGNQPVGYKDAVQGPPRQVRSWWDNMKSGFRNVSFNSSHGNNYSYNGGNGNYSNRYRPGYSNTYNRNRNGRNRNPGRRENGYNGVRYNNYNHNNRNYVNYEHDGDRYSYNNNARHDNYYDVHSRPEYVTQDRDW